MLVTIIVTQGTMMIFRQPQVSYVITKRILSGMLLVALKLLLLFNGAICLRSFITTNELENRVSVGQDFILTCYMAGKNDSLWYFNGISMDGMWTLFAFALFNRYNKYCELIYVESYQFELESNDLQGITYWNIKDFIRLMVVIFSIGHEIQMLFATDLIVIQFSFYILKNHIMLILTNLSVLWVWSDFVFI